jgi:hypothetical protein
MAPHTPIRDRLKELNTKAYYLLVGLSFLYNRSNPSRLLKLALTLTAIVAVMPVQDWITSDRTLEFIRLWKVAFLFAALGLAISWIWAVS